MKKITVLLGAALIASTSFAQTQEQVTVNGHRAVTKSVGNDKTPTDTLGWNNNQGFIPAEWAATGGAWNYGSAGGGYIYGANQTTSAWNECAQGYVNVNSATLGVEGAIMLFAGKTDAGTGNASLTVKFYDMAANSANSHDGTQWNMDAMGPSGAPKSSVTAAYSTLDTNFLAINYVAFPTVQNVAGGSFAISADFSAILAAGDTIGLLSDQDGQGSNLAFNSPTSQANTFYVSSSVWGGLNSNIALFPVIDANFVGVEDHEFFNNMQISAYPNPAVNNATIAYNLNENMDNVKLVVYDMTGREVYNETYGSQTKGSYKINIDASDFNAGNYFYSLITNGNRLTKRMVIAK